MKNISKILLLLASSFLLFACVNKSPDTTSSGGDPVEPGVDPVDPGGDPVEPTKYEKDEEGFYILEEDYFKHIDDDSVELDYANKISGVKYASNYRLFYGDIEIPVYGCNTNPARVWTGNPTDFIEAGVAVIGLSGNATFKLQTNFAFKAGSTRVSPLDREVKHELDLNRRVIEFEINECGQYTISFLKNMSFHFFVGPVDDYQSTMNNSNVIRFEEGLHNKNNSSYINSNNMINLNSNTTVILERGAVVEAGFIANSASHIEIIGDGIVLGANFSRNADNGSRLIPYEFNYCSDLVFKGTVNLDPAGWCYNIYFCNKVLLEDIKIISSRSNGDGVSLQSCQNVECKNSFVRSWDDSLVVKNYPKWSNRNEQGTTKNIKFEKCQIWTDLAQCMELGYETVGSTFEDIYFKDITVIFAYHKAVISIHNGNNAHIKNVHFDNITVENAKMGLGDGVNNLIDFANLYSSTWSDQHAKTGLGYIEDVYVNNVVVLIKNGDPIINIRGTKDFRSGYDNNEEHYVRNVNLHNIYLVDRYIVEDDPILRIGDYVYDLSITNDNNVIGANSHFVQE